MELTMDFTRATLMGGSLAIFSYAGHGELRAKS